MRWMVLALGTMLTFAACGSSDTTSSSPSPGGGRVQPASIKVSLPGLRVAFSQSDIAVAQAQGYFAQQALTVSTEGLSSGVQAVQSVLSGDSDIGGSSIEPVLSGAARGGLQIIGSYADRLPVVMEAQVLQKRSTAEAAKRLGQFVEKNPSSREGRLNYARALILDWRDHESRNEALAMLQQVAFVFIHQTGIATPRADDRWPATPENQKKVWETLEAVL